MCRCWSRKVFTDHLKGVSSVSVTVGRFSAPGKSSGCLQTEEVQGSDHEAHVFWGSQCVLISHTSLKPHLVKPCRFDSLRRPADQTSRRRIKFIRKLFSLWFLPRWEKVWESSKVSIFHEASQGVSVCGGRGEELSVGVLGTSFPPGTRDMSLFQLRLPHSESRSTQACAKWSQQTGNTKSLRFFIR